MAKIVPEGSSTVNLNLKDPYGSLMENLNVISKLQNISNTAKANRENKNKETLNNLSLVNGLIEKATSQQDLDFARNMYTNLQGDLNNDHLETYGLVTAQNLNKSSESFTNISNLGNEIGDAIYKKHSVWSDTNTVNNLSVNEMNTSEQIIDYYASMSDDKNALGNITSELDKIKIFKSELATKFTANKKMPGMKFNDENGQPVSFSEFKIKLNKHEQRLQMFIEAGFNDGSINEQEAQFIIRGDRDAYDNKREERDQNYKYLSGVDSNRIKNINKNINDLAEIDNDGWSSSLSDLTNPAAIGLKNEMINDKGFITAVFDYFKGIGKDSDIQISGEEEVDQNTVLNKFSKEGKLETIAFLNDYKKNAVAERDKNALAARSWGIGWYGSEPSLSDWSNNKKTLKKSNIYEGETEEVDTTVDYGKEVSEETETGTKTTNIAEETLDRELTEQEKVEIAEINKQRKIKAEDDSAENNISSEDPSTASKIIEFVDNNKVKIGVGAAVSGGVALHMSEEISNAVKNVTDNVKGLVISKEKVKDFIVDKKGVVADFNKKLEKVDINLKKEFKNIDKKIEIEKEKIKNINPKNSNNVSKDKANAQKRQKQLENSKVGKQKSVDIKKEKIKKNFIKTYAAKNKINIKDVDRLLDPSVNKKWENITKLKDKYSKMYNKRFKYLTSSNILSAEAGRYGAKLLGYDSTVQQLIGAGAGPTAKYIAYKYAKKNVPKIIKTKVYKAIALKVSQAAASKAVTASAGYLAGPVGIGTTILSAGLLLKDVYDITQMLFDDGTISKEEMEASNASALEQERFFNSNKKKSTINIQDSTAPPRKQKYDFSKFDK